MNASAIEWRHRRLSAGGDLWEAEAHGFRLVVGSACACDEAWEWLVESDTEGEMARGDVLSDDPELNGDERTPEQQAAIERAAETAKARALACALAFAAMAEAPALIAAAREEGRQEGLREAAVGVRRTGQTLAGLMGDDPEQAAALVQTFEAVAVGVEALASGAPSMSVTIDALAAAPSPEGATQAAKCQGCGNPAEWLTERGLGAATQHGYDEPGEGERP